MNYTNKIIKCCQHLKKGDIIIYPTDTVLGLGCDATNEKAIKNLIKIKQRNQHQGLIILVESLKMLSNYVKKIPKIAIKKIEKTEYPTTIIYNNPENLPKILYNNNSIAIRITKNIHCKNIISKINKPIVSTSANISGNPIPENFHNIDKELKMKVDFILEEKMINYAKTPSKIYKIENNKMILIR